MCSEMCIRDSRQCCYRQGQGEEDQPPHVCADRSLHPEVRPAVKNHSTVKALRRLAKGLFRYKTLSPSTKSRSSSVSLLPEGFSLLLVSMNGFYLPRSRKFSIRHSLHIVKQPPTFYDADAPRGWPHCRSGCSPFRAFLPCGASPCRCSIPHLSRRTARKSWCG